jgi:hypothetical protein
MLGHFLFRTQKANYPDGLISLQLKSSSNILFADERHTEGSGIFLEPVEGIQRGFLGAVSRERLTNSNLGRFHVLEKSGSNILAVSTMTTTRVIFRWWDMYRFTEEPPPPFDMRSIWVALLRSVGAAMRSATGA